MHFGLQKTLRLIVKNSTPRTLLLKLIHLHAFDFLKVLHTALSIVFSVKLTPAYLIAETRFRATIMRLANIHWRLIRYDYVHNLSLPATYVVIMLVLNACVARCINLRHLSSVKQSIIKHADHQTKDICKTRNTKKVSVSKHV